MNLIGRMNNAACGHDHKEWYRFDHGFEKLSF